MDIFPLLHMNECNLISQKIQLKKNKINEKRKREKKKREEFWREEKKKWVET